MNKFILLIILFLFLLLSCVIPGDLVGLKPTFDSLFDHSNLHDIELRFSQGEWDDFITDLEGDLKNSTYRKATFIYNGPIGKTIINDVGLRIKGNTTRTIPYNSGTGLFQRAHFKIKFDEPFDLGVGTTEYNERDERRFCSLNSLNVKWNRDSDNSQMRELYGYTLMEKGGADTSKTGSAKLTITIDGVKHYYGIYTIIEPIDKRFLKRIYDAANNDGNLYKCLWQQNGPATLDSSGISGKIGVKNWVTDYRPSYDRKTNTENTDYSDLISFAQQVTSLSGSALKTYLDANFEVDKFLRYLAMNLIFGMPDDYWAMGNNYFLYFSAGNKIRFIPYDYDHGLGGGWHPFDTANADIYTWSNVSGGTHALADKVMAISEYKSTYATYLEDFITPSNKLFVYSDYLAQYTALAALYTAALDNDMNEGETMSNDTSVRDYFYAKTLSIVTQLGLNADDFEAEVVTADPAPTIDGIKDASYYAIGIAEASTDGPGTTNFLECPSALYTYVTSTELYIYAPLNSPIATKRYVSVFLNRADGITTNTIVNHPDGSVLQKDSSWETLHAEGDLYYTYYPLWQTDNAQDETITKYYYDPTGSTWTISSSTFGTAVKFSATGFEMKIPLSTIHADGQSGKYLNVGIALKEEGLAKNIVDSYGGDNGTTANKVFIAASVQIP